MGRPQKKGLDYFPRSTNFCRDRRIVTIRTKFGNDGVQVYECILELIFDDGYYLEYNEDNLCSIATIVQVKLNTVRQVVEHLCRRSLLVKVTSKLTPSVTVLTSADIQRQYQAAVSGRAQKTPVSVEEEFWLLEKNETKSFIKVNPSLDSSRKNSDSSWKNSGISAKKCTKENKRNNYIYIDGRECAYLSNTEANELFIEYIKERQIDGTVLTERQITYLIEKLVSISEDPEIQKEAIKEATLRHWKSFYKVEKQETKKPKRDNGGSQRGGRKNSFNNFEQRSYDPALEYQLLGVKKDEGED